MLIGSNIHFFYLDPLIGDGLPWGSNIAIIGPPGVGKTVLCENLLCEGLKEGIRCLYITLDRPKNIVEECLTQQGIEPREYEQKQQFKILDGYPGMTGERGAEIQFSSLTDFGILISETISQVGNPAFIVLDSLSVMLIHNPESIVIKGLQGLMAKTKAKGNITIYVLEEGVHSKPFYNTVCFLADGVIQMKWNDHLERLIRAYTFKMARHATCWFPFSIEGKREFTLNADAALFKKLQWNRLLREFNRPQGNEDGNVTYELTK